MAKKSAMIDLIPGSMAMFMLPVSALDVAGIERKLLQTMEMITAKKRKVGLTQSDERLNFLQVALATREGGRRGEAASW